jgi:hypothetical protein
MIWLLLLIAVIAGAGAWFALLRAFVRDTLNPEEWP